MTRPAAHEAAAAIAGDALRRALAGNDEALREMLEEYDADVLEALLGAAEGLAADCRNVLEDK